MVPSSPPIATTRPRGSNARAVTALANLQVCPICPEQGCVPQADDPAFGPGGEDPAVRRNRQAHHLRPLGRQVEATFRLGVPDVEPPGPPPRDDRPAVGSQGDRPDRRVLMQLGLEGSPRRHVPAEDPPVSAAGGQRPAVGADGQRRVATLPRPDGPSMGRHAGMSRRHPIVHHCNIPSSLHVIKTSSIREGDVPDPAPRRARRGGRQAPAMVYVPDGDPPPVIDRPQQAALSRAESGTLQPGARGIVLELQRRSDLSAGGRVPDAGDAILAHRDERLAARGGRRTPGSAPNAASAVTAGVGSVGLPNRPG